MPAGVKGVEKDGTLSPGEVIVGTEFRLTAHAAPGLGAKNLMYFLEEERVLLSDQLMNEDAAVAVSAPGGDVAAYVETIQAAKKLRPKRVAPAIGHVLEDPADSFADHIAYQTAQTEKVKGALTESALAVKAIAGEVHGELGADNGELATATTLAHLELLAATASPRRTAANGASRRKGVARSGFAGRAVGACALRMSARRARTSSENLASFQRR